jgi:hypothetical protein
MDAPSNDRHCSRLIPLDSAPPIRAPRNFLLCESSGYGSLPDIVDGRAAIYQMQRLEPF